MWFSAGGESDQLSILRWLDGAFCRGFLPFSPLRSPRTLPLQVVGYHPPFSGIVHSSVDLAPTQAKLGSLRLGYAGQVVARGLSLVDSMVGPAWPRKEHTGLLPVARFLDGELFGDLSDPKQCLKPVEQWPSATPIGHVKASDEEWCKIVERGLRLGLVDTVDEADIFRDHNGNLVFNGATGVHQVEASSWWLNRGVAAFHLFFGTFECLLSPLAG